MPHDDQAQTGGLQTSRTAILAEARSWIGTPYSHQASCKGAGCDCLGLIRGVYRVFWGEPETPPPYSPDWADFGAEETLAKAAFRHLRPVCIADRQPGDILLFRYRNGHPAKHAAILSMKTHIIHAQHNASVAEVALSPWWLRRLAYVFAFPFPFKAE